MGIGDKDKILTNKYVGHMLRTKKSHVNGRGGSRAGGPGLCASGGHQQVLQEIINKSYHGLQAPKIDNYKSNILLPSSTKNTIFNVTTTLRINKAYEDLKN